MHRKTDARANLWGLFPALCAVCLLIAASPVWVTASPPDEETRPERRVPQTGRQESPASTATRGDETAVVGGPETGKVVSDATRRQEDALSAPLANALNRSTEGLRVFGLANGGAGIHLEGRYQHAIVVRMKADGSFETVCVNHAHEAEAFLKRGSAEIDTQRQDK